MVTLSLVQSKVEGCVGGGGLVVAEQLQVPGVHSSWCSETETGDVQMHYFCVLVSNLVGVAPLAKLTSF